jgi:hypothetical protein
MKHQMQNETTEKKQILGVKMGGGRGGGRTQILASLSMHNFCKQVKLNQWKVGQQQ